MSSNGSTTPPGPRQLPDQRRKRRKPTGLRIAIAVVCLVIGVIVLIAGFNNMRSGLGGLGEPRAHSASHA